MFEEAPWESCGMMAALSLHHYKWISAEVRRGHFWLTLMSLVHTEDCLGLPHGGTLSSIWTFVRSSLGFSRCSKKHHGSPSFGVTTREVAGYELRPPQTIFRVKLKVFYDGSTKTLHHSYSGYLLRSGEVIPS